MEHYLGSLGDALEATVSGHGLGQAGLGFFLRYLNAGNFPLVNEYGINDALLESSFTSRLEGDRPVVKDAGNFALDQGEVGSLYENRRKASVLCLNRNQETADDKSAKC